MKVKQLLKLDEEGLSRLTAWPRFIVGVALITSLAASLFVASMIVGYGLKAYTLIEQRLRNTRLN